MTKSQRPAFATKPTPTTVQKPTATQTTNPVINENGVEKIIQVGVLSLIASGAIVYKMLSKKNNKYLGVIKQNSGENAIVEITADDNGDVSISPVNNIYILDALSIESMHENSYINVSEPLQLIVPPTTTNVSMSPPASVPTQSVFGKIMTNISAVGSAAVSGIANVASAAVALISPNKSVVQVPTSNKIVANKIAYNQAGTTGTVVAVVPETETVVTTTAAAAPPQNPVPQKAPTETTKTALSGAMILTRTGSKVNASFTTLIRNDESE